LFHVDFPQDFCLSVSLHGLCELSPNLGDAIENVNGRRAFLNAIFVPSSRPGACGFTFNPQADLQITKTNTPGVNNNVDQANDTVARGSTTTYQIVVSNAGSADVTGAVVKDPASTGLTCSTLGCTGAACPASPTVAQLQSPSGVTLGNLLANTSVTFSLGCQVN
jgi:uncharacterized repeat protein (TIGR01451 family)